MGRVIRNVWTEAAGSPLRRAAILDPDRVPEGVEVERTEAHAATPWALPAARAHVLAVLRGAVHLPADGLRVGPGAHLYVPLDAGLTVQLEPGTAVVRVSSAWARGTHLSVRDEAFVSACAVEGQSLRWILTPQYLSRRVLLHHDHALLSKGGHPLSWFHTTMFDVAGLPPNDEGESVFKMSYNSRTELNVCYDVTGDARVRMARHPYASRAWGPWERLDGDATYHLDEASDGPEVEREGDKLLRNKHEVLARGGHVSLYCVFDPAPTGVERHRPGEYSDYEPLADVVGRDEYRVHQREIARLDSMVDELSRARARGELERHRGGAAWAVYQAGRAAQRALESGLVATLAAEGKGRDQVVEPWLSRGEL